MSERVEHWMVCDGCGKQGPRRSTYFKALYAVIVDEEWIEMGSKFEPEHYCVECQKVRGYRNPVRELFAADVPDSQP